VKYEFKEDKTLEKVQEFIKATYRLHYAGSKQSTEEIFEAGFGESFCIGNIMKYARRYGKKGKKKELDLYKLIHYAIILIGKLDEEREKDAREYEQQIQLDMD
tara:strand:+ start:269 stop:577 length:309 start_codon:yes stop_codon:yes gene_type:complete